MKAAYYKPFLLATVIVLVDQIIKIWVFTHMSFQQDIEFLGRYGRLHYTLNPGMAFGWEWGGDVGKLGLTFFRIAAVILISWGIVYLIRHKYHRGLIMNVAMILAGALGNIIDSVFYGLVYQHKPLFQGSVVDMFYFPIVHGTYPSWLPILGGQSFEFFEPVFNFADASISIGVILILIFQKHYFKRETIEPISTNSEVVED